MTPVAATAIERADPVQGKAGVWLAATSLLTLLTWMGYRLVFSQFQRYDDEGYLLITVKQFLEGHPLYDEVYTQYGPAYYLWQQFLHGVLGIPLTHHATRIVTLAVWIACAGLLGVPVWLLTKRRLLTALAIATAFFHISQLTFEPGHPQELCMLAILIAITISMWRFVVYGRLGIAVSAALGGLVALTVFTKVNLGAFLAASVALALVFSLRASKWRNALVALGAISAMALVPALMHGDIFRGDIVAWIVVVWCGLLAAFAASWNEKPIDGVVSWRDLIALMTGVAVVSVLVVVAIVSQGTTLRALVDGLLVQPSRFPSVFWRPQPVPPIAAAIGLLSLYVGLSHRRQVTAVRNWMPLVALGLGQVAFLLSVAKAYRTLLALGPPLVWLTLGDSFVESGERAARRVLAFAAIFMTLQTYPMPDGTQILLGTALFVPVALITIADAERRLRGDRQPRAQPHSSARRAIIAGISAGVVLIVGARVQYLHARAVPLGMPGAETVRTNERDAATYKWLTTNLRENCDAFVSAPGINSLHFWTGIPPVSTLNATLWPRLFDDQQQRRVIAAASPVRRFCVAWSRWMPILMNPPVPGTHPLVNWLATEFEGVASFGDWEFRVRRGEQAELSYQARIVGADLLELDLPALGERIAGIVVVDTDTDGILNANAQQTGLIITDEAGAAVRLDDGIDVSRPRRLVVNTALEAPSTEHAPIVIRLLARDSRLIAIVPVVTDGPSRTMLTQ